MSALVGTGQLVRLGLRRERRIAGWWLAGLVALALVMVSYIERNMGTPELLARYVSVINQNSFFRSLGGGFVVADPQYMAAWRSGGFLYVLNALAALSTVVRHTRADEETGRTELLRSAPLSRFAPLTAALSVAIAVSLAGGLLPAVALIAIGLDPFGSLAYGAGIAAAGLVFAGVGAVAAQVSRSARTARVIGLTVLGVSYVMRYAGDATGATWLKDLSPIGWSHLVAPYWNDRLWVLGISVAVTGILVAVAYRLNDRRDYDAGLIPAASGPATSRRVRGPVSLAWRVNRGLLLGWVAAIAAGAAAAAGVSTMGDQIANAPGGIGNQLLEGFGGRPGAHALDYGLWAIILIFAHVVVLYPVLMVRRLRTEEVSGRGELVLATTATRVRWVGGQAVVAAIGTAVLLAVTGLVMGGGYALLVTGSADDAWRVLGGVVGTIPAAWLLGAVCLACYGFAPRATPVVGWLVWIGAALAGRVAGPLYGLWGGTPFEPFHYVPNTVAGAAFDPVPALVMLGLTGLLVAGGLWAVRRRDFG